MYRCVTGGREETGGLGFTFNRNATTQSALPIDVRYSCFIVRVFDHTSAKTNPRLEPNSVLKQYNREFLTVQPSSRTL